MQISDYFKFSGRIPRQTWWLGQLVTLLILFAVIYAVSFIFAGPQQSLQGEAGLASSEDIGPIGLTMFFIAWLIYLWVTMSLNAQRWHDRDKSAWWMLISLIPLVGIWALIENGFLRGTEGANRFGSDPLEK